MTDRCPAAPAITVGLPFFNAEKTLRLAIESVLVQESPDFELLLVNDASTDASAAITRDYLSDSRVRLIEHHTNRGLALRLNEITGHARGRYIARMDADDIMHPCRLRMQLELLEGDPSIDLVCSDIYIIDGEHRVLGRRSTATAHVCHRFSYLKPFHPTVTGRRAWFEQNPYSCDFRRCEDTELWVRTAGAVKIAITDRPLLYFNRVSGFTLRKTVASLRESTQVLRHHRNRTCFLCRLATFTATRIKEACYYALSFSGLARMAISRWHVLPLSRSERSAAECVLTHIINSADARGAIPIPANPE